MMATKKNMSFLWFPIMIKMMRMLDTHTKSVSPNSTNMIFLETIMVMLPLRSYKAEMSLLSVTMEFTTSSSTHS